MSEESVKIGGITGMFTYFAYGISYFAFICALLLGGQGFIAPDSFIAEVSSHLSNFLKGIEGKAIFVVAAAVAFVSFITGTLLNDMAKRFTVISLILLAGVSFIAVVLANILINH